MVYHGINYFEGKKPSRQSGRFNTRKEAEEALNTIIGKPTSTERIVFFKRKTKW